MKDIINSPIIITVIAIAALFVLQSRMKPKLASEIGGAYDEIVRIIEDGGSDMEKSKAIQTFAKEISSQLKTGFSAGFSSGKQEKKETSEEKFLRLQPAIVTSEFKELASARKGSQEFIYKLTNKINYEYYNGDTLVDVENDWVSEIKSLAAGGSISLKQSRSLPRELSEEDQAALRFDRVDIILTSFDVIEKKEEQGSN